MNHTPINKTPAQTFQAALEKLRVFAQAQPARLDISEDGAIVASSQTLLDKVVGLAQLYVAPLLFDPKRDQRFKKLSKLKDELLKARDIVKSHAALIERLKKGSLSEQKLAHTAVEVIQQYNAFVEKDGIEYGLERHQLLQDAEIKGQQILLPRSFKTSYSSHTGQQTLKQLSSLLSQGPSAPTAVSSSLKHKKQTQFLKDTFRLKATRLLEGHLKSSHSVGDIMQQVKQSGIEIIEEPDTNRTVLRQFLEFEPGSYVVLTGTFRTPAADSVVSMMPILEELQISAESIQSGFPYPSQYSGWALPEKLSEPHALRNEHLPLYRSIAHQKSALAHDLLYNAKTKQRSLALFNAKKAAFDDRRHHLLALHKQLQEILLKEAVLHTPEAMEIIEAFHASLAEAQSPYSRLSSLYLQVIDLFVHQPIEQLERLWLEGENSALRNGSPQEKVKAAKEFLEMETEKALQQVDARSAWVRLIGRLYAEGSRGIILQYFSETIGFAPPLLTDFERKWQMCAFQQQLQFLEEMQKPTISIDADVLAGYYQADLKLFQSSANGQPQLMRAKLSNELEGYFTARFYQNRS